MNTVDTKNDVKSHAIRLFSEILEVEKLYCVARRDVISLHKESVTRRWHFFVFTNESAYSGNLTLRLEAAAEQLKTQIAFMYLQEYTFIPRQLIPDDALKNNPDAELLFSRE